MRPTFFLLSLLALACLPPAAAAQGIAGTYAGTGTNGPITLTLTQQGNQVRGSLEGGGATFQVEGQADGSDVVGVATSREGSLYLEARVEGAQLRLIMASMGANMQPDYQNAREITLSRGGAAGPVAAAPAPSRPATGNPLAGGGGSPLAQPASDPFVGTFAGAGIAMTVQKSGEGYAGTLESQGARFPFTAQPAAGRITGTFAAGGTTYLFEARVQGNTLSLLSDGQTHQLQRAGAAAGGANPLAAAGPGAAPDAAGTSQQDQQITQILLSSRWCYMSFSSGGGASGRTNTEKVTFSPDGMMSVSTGSESYYSNPYGSVAGQGAGGQQVRWRIQNAALQVSADGVQWTSVPLQIYPNSNGSPIVKTGDGKEYSRCS